MPIGALIGLKKMMTSPFGPAILISIALFTIIGFQYLEIKSLKGDNEIHISNSASLKVAKDMCENETRGLRSKINNLTFELKTAEDKHKKAELKVKQSSNQIMADAIVKAEKQIKEVKTAKEITQWYQEAFK